MLPKACPRLKYLGITNFHALASIQGILLLKLMLFYLFSICFVQLYCSFVPNLLINFACFRFVFHFVLIIFSRKSPPAWIFSWSWNYKKNIWLVYKRKHKYKLTRFRHLWHWQYQCLLYYQIKYIPYLGKKSVECQDLNSQKLWLFWIKNMSHTRISFLFFFFRAILVILNERDTYATMY